MLKYLLVVLVVVGVLWLLAVQRRRERGREEREEREAGRGRGPGAARPTPPGRAAPRSADTPATITRCAHCGLHLPRSEAVHAGDRDYCSTEHRLAGPERPR